jgi:type II secretion system protein I
MRVERSGFRIQHKAQLDESGKSHIPPSAFCFPPSGSRSAFSHPWRARRSAFTLLEVILALAILAGAVAAIGELVRVGLHNAEVARQLTRAEMLCESVSDQIAGGAIAATSTSGVQCDDDPRFLYSVAVDQANQSGLLSVQVTVVRDLPAEEHPVPFKVTRWMVDPGIESQQMSTEATNAANAAAAASTGSTGSTGTTGTGS